VGTPAFMAPEQAAGRRDEIDALTDIWAVGATLFQLATGRLVHEAPNSHAAIVAAATRPAESIAGLRPELPAGFAAAIDRALAFQRDDRWPNAKAMRMALLATGIGEGPPAMPLAMAPETVPEMGRAQADARGPAAPAGSRRRAVSRSVAGWVLAAVAVALA